MQGQFEAVGRFPTTHARKYMTQLCKHFAHKVPAEVEGDLGRVSFPMGEARIEASDHEIVARVVAESADGVQRMQGVIDSHLQRFAFREGFEALTWSETQSV